MKLVFDEWYGTLSFAQRAAYRKHNVSPSDHDDLVEKFGAESHDEITRAVKMNANRNNGMFQVFDLYLDR